MAFWRKLKRKASLFASFLALFALSLYRVFLSSFLGSGGGCRFYPSCGEYASLAYEKLSFWRASRLVFQRLLDCRPFGPKFREEPDLLAKEPLKGERDMA